MERVRFAAIGLGWFVEYHADVIASLAQAELYALCTRTESRLKALSQKFGVACTYTDYRELLEDPDIEAVLPAPISAPFVPDGKLVSGGSRFKFRGLHPPH